MPVARRRRARSCLLALLALVLGLAGLEGALRLLGVGEDGVRSPFALELALGSKEALLLPDEELFFRLAPHHRLLGFYDLDAHGWRGPEVIEPKPAGTLRLVATGDSSTFGLGVPAEAVWTAVLARLLGAVFEESARVEVVSAGVPSYSTAQNRVQVRRDLPALEPDVLLLLATGHNDAVATHGRTDAEEAAARGGWRGWLSSLALARVLHLGQDAEAATGAGASAAPARPRVGLAELEGNLRAIAAEARAQGTPLLLVAPPHPPEPDAVSPGERAAEEVVAAVAAAEGVALADPLPAFAALVPRTLFLDGIHPDATGHRLIAWAVAEALVAEGGPLGRHERAAFARAWLAARREGLPAHEAALLAAEAPPRFTALRAQHADPAAMLEALRGRARDVPPPLVQPRGAPAPLSSAESRLRLLAEDERAAPPQERALARRAAEECRAFVSPRETLASLLVGEGGPWAAPAPRLLALACALEAFEAELDCSPARQDRRLREARLRLAEGADAAALERLDVVLALDPRCADAHFQRGAALDRLGRRAEAQASYDRALELAPDSATGQFLRGKSAFQHGDRAQAEPGFRAAIALDPAFTLPRYALGRLLLEQGRLDEAEQQLTIVLALAAGDYDDVPALLQQVAARRKEAR